jgi:hypothetical protein
MFASKAGAFPLGNSLQMIRLEGLAKDKHSGLLQTLVKYNSFKKRKIRNPKLLYF